MIDIVNVQKIYPSQGKEVKALDSIHLHINKGEMVAVLGPSGSGKTSLLNCICGIDKPSSGLIEIDGVNLDDLHGEVLQEFRRGNFGYIFQDFRLLSQYNVIDNIMLPLLPYKPIDQIKKVSESLLEKLSLNHRIYALPSTLSGGEKQRVAIARALLANPLILLCDEPTGNLDKDNRDNIMNILMEIKKEGRTVIMVTHDSENAKKCDRQLFIRDGVLIEGIMCD